MKKLLLFAAAVLLLNSCEKDQEYLTSGQSGATLKKYAELSAKALANASGGAVTASAGQGLGRQVSIPFKSSGSGTIAYTPDGCGSGTLRVRSDGTGNSTQLGLLTQVTDFCVDAATGFPIGPITGVGTAANGDKLYYTFIGGGIDEATGYTYQDYVFSGGTGRFAGASGTLRLLYSVRTPTNYSYTGTGTISY